MSGLTCINKHQSCSERRTSLTCRLIELLDAPARVLSAGCTVATMKAGWLGWFTDKARFEPYCYRWSGV
ncbi:hypothetical protein RRG08_019044 [Elysia crispata]|uniref:Uncharacterized protein n=1 Tax=Elysia crispata TaxID=231223 RepID=A0AAE1A510_9GAST|nr:hypothetical protein RRG08_019044 [Elysia crispata]